MTFPEHHRGLREEPLGPPAAPVTSSALHPTPIDTEPPRRRRTGLVVGGVAAVLVAAAGGSFAATTLFRQHDKPAVAVSPPAPSATAAAPVAADSPLPSVAPRLKLGQATGLGADDPATATVYAYRQPTGAGAPAPDTSGYVWSSADVKVCALANAAGNTISVSNQPWALVYADGTVIQPSSIGYRQFQQPEYPWEAREVPWGHCVRGWITFAVPRGQRPTAVEYQVQAGTFDWAIS